MHSSEVNTRERIDAMKTVSRRIPPDKGSALLTSLMVVSALIVLGVGYLSSQNADYGLMIRSQGWLHAENVAEAGAELAIWEINDGGADFVAGGNWTGAGTTLVPYVRTGQLTTAQGTVLGDYEVNVEQIDTATFTVTSTGFFPSQVAPLAQREVKLELLRKPLFDKAVKARGQIAATNRLEADSYDSSLGSYDSQTPGSDTDFYTNATGADAVKFGPSSSILGNIFVGPGGNAATDITLGSGSTVSGVLGAASAALSPEVILPPSGLTSAAAIDISTIGGTGAIPPGTWVIPSITVAKNATLNITGDTVISVTGNIDMKTSSQLHVADGAHLTVYLNPSSATNITLGNKTTFTCQTPEQLAIYADSNVSKITIGCQGVFIGTIYAPDTEVKCGLNMGEVYGAFIGKLIDFGPAMVYHYDTALRTTGPLEQIYSVQDWQSKNATP